MQKIVTIVGRPNVGKSTLFNRMVEERKAIIYDDPGVTRDRNWGICEWNGVKFTVIDTGGLVTQTDDVFERAIKEQIEIAISRTDLILFVLDVVDGVTALDYEVTEFLRQRKHKCPVVLVVNKVDNFKRSQDAMEAYALGDYDEYFAISSMSGSGTGELLDKITELIGTEQEEEVEEEVLPRIAIVGKPNVGKSSLINALLGSPEQIVTPIPGTTRDSIYTRYKSFGFDYNLIDTAGLRRRAKVTDNIEYYSTIRTVRSISECDVAIVIVDGTETLDAQDLSIIAIVEKNNKGIVIAINKWDIVPDKSPAYEQSYRKHIESRIMPLSDVPIIFMSALEKQRIYKVMQTAGDVYKERNISRPEN